MWFSKTARPRFCCRMPNRRIQARAPSTNGLGLNERELDILQVSVPKQHYYVVSKLGRRLVDLGVGKVALAWVGVNGREERQIVETVMEQFGDAWRAEWLRLRGLQKWADYLRSLEERGRGGIGMRKFVIAVLILFAVSADGSAKSGSRRVRDGGYPAIEPCPTRAGVHPAGSPVGERTRDVRQHASEHEESLAPDIRPDPG